MSPEAERELWQRIFELADRALKLERAVYEIGRYLAFGLALVPAYEVGQQLDRFGFPSWVVWTVGTVVWGIAGCIFHKGLGGDLRP